MANLKETAQWEDGIYQIETSDPVLGGPDGISNKQAKLLANRTSFLKQRVEAGAQGLATHIAASDPHTQYAPKESPVFTGKPVGPTAVQTSNDTQLATTAFVKAALAALVASSPEALDTLNELAAALGNDPNFATTMTNALAGKQPLDNTLTALSGKSVSALLEYLGLKEITGRLLNIRTITTSGTYIPTQGTASIIVEAIGGGGASGNLTATGATQNAVSAAGSNGAYAKARYTSGFSSVSVTVGAGGTVNGAGGGSGGDGGTTSFGSLLVCPAGKGSEVGIAKTPPFNDGGAQPSSSPSGTGIIISRNGPFSSWPTVVALGMSSNFANSIISPLGGYGLGGDGVASNTSEPARNGNPGSSGVVIVWEYS